jgi:hypothetical protein
MESPRLRKGEKDDLGNEIDYRCDWRCDISATFHAFGSMMRQTLAACSAYLPFADLGQPNL